MPPSRVQPLSSAHIKNDYVRGDRVRANWHSCGTWCLGRVQSVDLLEGTFNVQYDDGEIEARQHTQRCHPFAAPELGPCASSGHTQWLWVALGGSTLPGGERDTPGHWAPNHRLGCSGQAASKVADSTAFGHPGADTAAQLAIGRRDGGESGGGLAICVPPHGEDSATRACPCGPCRGLRQVI